MDTDERELLGKDEVYAIVSCAFDILNGIGHGFHEKPYENALAVEFKHRNIPFIQQPRFPIKWRDAPVGEFIPDLIAYETVIIDTKTIDCITPSNAGKCSTTSASPASRSASSSTSKNQNSNGNASS